MSSVGPPDRVTELYRGEIFTPESQAICRDRVHWICSRASGRRVLDVGCSQGIVAFLLAEEGFEVLGVDVDDQAIEFARREAEQLPAEAASRLSFTVADVQALDPREIGSFDTIVLGEILEHFTHPERLLEACIRFAAGGARLVITVPFGVHPHASHRTTFTLTRFVELVGGRLEPRELEGVAGYLRFVGVPRTEHAGEGAAFDPGELLELTERSLLWSQQRLFSQLDESRKALERTRQRVDSWHQRARRAEQELASRVGGAASEASGEKGGQGRSGDAALEASREMQWLRASLDDSERARTRLERDIAELERHLAARSELIRRKQRLLEGSRASLAAGRTTMRSLEEELASIRRSTAYRLGRQLTTSARSPLGLVRLLGGMARLALDSVSRRVGRYLRPPVSAAEAKRRMEDLLARRGYRAAEDWARRSVEAGRIPDLTVRKILFSLLKDHHLEAAVRHGDRALALQPDDERLARVLAVRHRRLGNVERADALATQGLAPTAGRSEGALGFQELKQALQAILDSDGTAGADEWCKIALERGLSTELELNRILFALTRRTDVIASLRYGERSFELSGDLEVGRALMAQYRSLGRLHCAREFALRLDPTDASLRGEAFLAGQIALLEHGFPPPPRRRETVEPEPGRVLYLLHNSLPFTSGGYATRSHGLARALREAGCDLRAATRLGFPLDFKKNPVEDAPELDEIDGVPYLRLLTRDRGYGAAPLPDYLRDYAEAVVGLARDVRPSIIHAASNFMNGVVGNFAAAALGLPSVYEVRGLWEITRLSRQPEWGGSDQFRMLRRMETQAALDATAVITITAALRGELIDRGVPPERITVVPNSVDPDRFAPRPRDAELERRLGLSGRVVIGYVGSVVDYEGLDDLLGALSVLQSKGVDGWSALVVGDGEAMPALRDAVAERGLADRVHLVGRVAHDEVERYYSLIDVVPYPRKPLPVCEMVSPIKPFEAMAMAKAVTASSVAALAEIVDDGETGLLFEKGDVEDLAAKLERLVLDSDLRKALGERAREWVIRERSWSAVARRVEELYRELAPEMATASAR